VEVVKNISNVMVSGSFSFNSYR